MAYYDDIKDKKAPFESHYISAYGLAVKHGFTGSEEEWLESLSDYGIAKKHGFTGSEEEWNDAVNAAREAAETAKTGAEDARDDAVSAMTTAESHENEAYKHSQNSKEYASSASESANSANIYMRTAEGYSLGAANAVSEAEDARDETKKIKTEVEKIAEELSGYIKVSDIFKNETFAWTDFPYTADGTYGFCGKVNADSIVIDNAEENESIDISCYGYRLGFTVTVSGWGRLRINGVNMVLEDETVVFPPTYISSVLRFFGNGSTWTFTDMVKQIPILGIPIDTELNAESDNPIANSAVARVVGDIDSALDEIIAIADALIEGDG